MYYEDEPPPDPAADPTEARTKATPSGIRVTFDLAGYDEDRIESAIVESMVRRLWKRQSERINKEIERRVDEAIPAVIAEVVRPEVERIVAEGWPQTSHYGEVTGPRVSLKERISKWLDARNDSYGRGVSKLEQVVTAAVNDAIGKELAEELKRVREAFKAQIDAVLQAKLRETLAASLGLKS